MFSTAQRIQEYSGFMTSVVLIMLAVISATSLIHEHMMVVPSASISIGQVDVHRRPRTGYNYRNQEYSSMYFDLEADLRPVFNWNTKQIFVYLTASYPGRPFANKVVLWDRIIQNKEDAKFSLHNESSAYEIYDVGGKFNERTATVRLEWNHQPFVGFLTYNKSPESTKFAFPSLE
ncbi:signal peptidase 22kDa subunit [Lipomyces oligophaga]|uniref:signal peptidase 22kDa subunit n=1 Tax=Lipomyces oligophaga TaxID=45792 RepID=UPI0034D004BD